MTQFYTYLHCKPNGDPFYVGKGTVGTKRVRSHDLKFNRNDHHRNITAKHGLSNIQIFVFPCDTEGQAFADEKQQIAQLRAEGYILANITEGGDGVMGGRKHSAETRAKISAANKGNNRCLGTKRTLEQRKKFAESQKHVVLKETTKSFWFKKGHAPWNKEAPPKTHCKHGHKLSEENLYEGVRVGGRKFRTCKTCSRISTAAYINRKRGSK